MQQQRRLEAGWDEESSLDERERAFSKYLTGAVEKGCGKKMVNMLVCMVCWYVWLICTAQVH